MRSGKVNLHRDPLLCKPMISLVTDLWFKIIWPSRCSCWDLSEVKNCLHLIFLEYSFLKSGSCPGIELFQTNHLPTNHGKIFTSPPQKKKNLNSFQQNICLFSEKQPRAAKFLWIFSFWWSCGYQQTPKEQTGTWYPKIHMNQDFAVHKPNSGVLVSCRYAPFRGISLDFSKIRWESRSCCYHLRVLKGCLARQRPWFCGCNLITPQKTGSSQPLRKTNMEPPHQKGWVLEDGRFPFAKRSGTKISHSFQLLACRWHTIFWCLIHCKNWRKRYR